MPSLPPPPEPIPYRVPDELETLRRTVRAGLKRLASKEGRAASSAIREKLSQSSLERPRTEAMRRSLVEKPIDPLEETACPGYAKP